MMLLVYQLIYPVIALIVLIHLSVSGRGRALRESWGDLKERLGIAPPRLFEPLKGATTVWVHAASVGEVMAAAPLIRRILAEPDPPKILITTSTVTGRIRAQRLPGIAAALLAPIDFYPAVAAFLKRAAPKSLILVETELWPMTLRLALNRGLAVGIVNGRITPRAFRRYRWLTRFWKPLLSGFSKAAVQTSADIERFAALGVPKEVLSAAGNMKYDLDPPAEKDLREAKERLEALGWKDAPIWTAGSTRRGEEQQVLDAHRKAAEKLPGLRLILAPRHPERAEEAAGILRERGLKFVRWSEPLPSQADPECLLVDTLGALGALYPAGRAAFVGGSLVPVGGHNLLEPAMAGLPVLFGPHTESTPSVAEELVNSGGGTRVSDAASLAEALSRLLGDPAHAQAQGRKALRTAKSFAGATERSFEHLRPLFQL